MTKCYEMKKGQKLICVDCGFTLVVDEECDGSCKEQECSTVEIICCGAPMIIE